MYKQKQKYLLCVVLLYILYNLIIIIDLLNVSSISMLKLLMVVLIFTILYISGLLSQADHMSNNLTSNVYCTVMYNSQLLK